MPPTDRFVISYAAEPPQEPLAYGRWADALREHFLTACRDIDTEGEEIGRAGEIRWFPDRTYSGRTYIPAVARTDLGYELFGFVSFTEGGENGGGPADFEGHADFTADIAENNPDWKLDLNSWTISAWRGENGHRADVALVWGVPLIPGGEVVTAELANLAVDQCALLEERFTIVAADSYRGDYLDVKLWDAHGHELAAEALYDDEDDGSDDEDDGSDDEDGLDDRSSRPDGPGDDPDLSSGAEDHDLGEGDEGGRTSD